MTLFQLYVRSLAPLFNHRAAITKLAIANIGLAVSLVCEPILLGRVIDALLRGGQIATPLIVWAIVAIATLAVSVLLARRADRLAHACRADLLSDSHDRVLRMPLTWHHAHGTSKIFQTVVRGCESQFNIWLEFMRSDLSMLVALALLLPAALSINLVLGCVLLMLGVSYWSIQKWVIARTRTGQFSIEEHYHRVFALLNDTISHVALLHGYNRIHAETALLRRQLENLLGAQYPVLDWWAMASALTRMATLISMGTTLVLGSILVQRQNLSLGELVTFIGFSGVLISRLDQVRGLVNLIHESAPRLEDFLSMRAESAGAKIMDDLPNANLASGKIEFRDVSFGYDTNRLNLKSISFVIEPGQTVAIVGTTGAGKSTIVNLLQRLYNPTTGQILIDDIDILHVSARSIRDQIAVVSQVPELLNRSIAENIGLGRENATIDDIRRAARSASAERFIESKQYGYSSFTGNGGVGLSGGECQRIAIARAILKSAPILILDEATSALDVETECEVKNAIQQVSQGRTTIIIAHRLSTIRNADLVLVMKNGTLVESGTYSGLSQKDGCFAAMLSMSGMKAERAQADHLTSLA